MHPNYQALIDFSVGSLASQSKFPSEPYKYICSNGARCIIGLLLPERIIDTLDNRSIGYDELNTEALKYISITFGLPNTKVLANVLSNMQITFDIKCKEYKNDFDSFLVMYKQLIEKYIERVTKYESFSV